MVVPAEDVSKHINAKQPIPVTEQERPSLSVEFYKDLLGGYKCSSPEKCIKCGRCEY